MAPLTIENTAALVSGAASKEAVMQEIKVKILRAFIDHQKKVVRVGDTVTLPKIFALEMIAANKAERVEEPVVPAPAAPAPPAKEAAKKEGGNHVR